MPYQVVVDVFAGSTVENMIAAESGVLPPGAKLCGFNRFTRTVPYTPNLDMLGVLIDEFTASYAGEGKESFFVYARVEDTYGLGLVPMCRGYYNRRVHTISDGRTHMSFASALRSIGYEVKTDILRNIVTVNYAKRND
jgi:hypothetical protein